MRPAAALLALLLAAPGHADEPEWRPGSARLALDLAAGGEAAWIQGVPVHGPTASLALVLAGRPRDGAPRFRAKVHLRGRIGETPEGLRARDIRLGGLFGIDLGRFGFGAGPELAFVTVKRVGPGELSDEGLALRLAADASLWESSFGALFVELTGSTTRLDASAGRQRSAALLLGYRFHLR